MTWAVAVFCVSAGSILYVLFGYPLLLGWIAARREKPVSRLPGHEPTVSILMAVHNGEPWIREKLRCLLALDYPRSKTQILVADDGSGDRTAEILRSYSSEGVAIVPLPRGGKAAALNALLERAQGEILFFTDVRQTIEPSALRRLAECFGDLEVGVASGELFIRSGESTEHDSVGLYWRYEKWIRKNLSRVDSIPGATGCIYAMRRELARPVPADTLLDDVYLPLGAFFRGYRVVMEDTARAYDAPTSLTSEFRRKVRTLAGVYQVIGFYPALLGRSNRMLWHFLSHKLGRLLLPSAMIGAAVASLWLPPGWREAGMGLQAAFYLLALADLRIPETSGLKRISSPVRAFVVLMAASVCALSILFVPAAKLWAPPARREEPQARGAAAGTR